MLKGRWRALEMRGGGDATGRRFKRSSVGEYHLLGLLSLPIATAETAIHHDIQSPHHSGILDVHIVRSFLLRLQCMSYGSDGQGDSSVSSEVPFDLATLF
jgi:hypothetical protein